MTRTVNSIARGLLRVAEYGVINLVRLDAGALHRLDRGNRAKFLSREIP